MLLRCRAVLGDGWDVQSMARWSPCGCGMGAALPSLRDRRTCEKVRPAIPRRIIYEGGGKINSHSLQFAYSLLPENQRQVQRAAPQADQECDGGRRRSDDASILVITIL